MMHAFMKALYASGEQHSPTCWPAVVTLPADMSMYSQELEAFARSAGPHNLHQPLLHYSYNVQSSSACMQDLPSGRGYCGQLAV